MKKKHPHHLKPVSVIRSVSQYLLAVSALSATLFFGLFVHSNAHANDAVNDNPAIIVEKTVNALLGEFSEKRAQLQDNNRELFELVNRIASPLFDFDYIAKLVLAKSWKKASAQQRKTFANEFKRLIIVTYSTALFQYTGNKTIAFGKSKIKEKKGVKFGTVNTEINLGEGNTIPVNYSLIQRNDQQWKIYNLTVGSLNMVLNYRNIIQASVHSEGLARVIVSMKANNDKHY